MRDLPPGATLLKVDSDGDQFSRLIQLNGQNYVQYMNQALLFNRGMEEINPAAKWEFSKDGW